jgi:hypothetical protein
MTALSLLPADTSARFDSVVGARRGTEHATDLFGPNSEFIDLYLDLLSRYQAHGLRLVSGDKVKRKVRVRVDHLMRAQGRVRVACTGRARDAAFATANGGATTLALERVLSDSDHLVAAMDGALALALADVLSEGDYQALVASAERLVGLQPVFSRARRAASRP